MTAKVASADVVQVPPEEKTMPSVDTELEHDDLASLGEISLSRSGDDTPDGGTRQSNGSSGIIDPWALVDTNHAEDNVQNPPNESWAARWVSIRSRWTSTGPATPLEDEQPAAVIKPEPPPIPSPQSEPQPQAQRGFSLFKSKTAPTTMDPTNLSAEERASLRASTISVTVQKETLDSKWGFGIDQSGDKVEIKVITGTGLLEHAPFQVGDTLVSVNNQKCTSAERTIQELVKMEAGIPVTLIVETPQGNPNLVQAMVRKPSADANLGIGFYVPAEPVEVKPVESVENDATTTSVPIQLPVSNDANSKIANDPTSKLLRINNIDANGLLSHSALRQGDLVMAINATPCSQMTADEASALLHQSDDSVTITAMKAPSQASSRTQWWLRQARRVGVAIGGGTLVGVGLIFIPTLPPPFGEVLIVGGVSVLGTEFEGPKRVMKSARDSLERAVGREIANEKPHEGDAGPNPPETESSTVEGEPAESGNLQPSTNTNTDSTPTIGDRFKNFGRHHVLPFLDQVVGDRNEIHKENSTVQDSIAEGSASVDDSNKMDMVAPETLVQENVVDADGVQKVDSTIS